MSNHLQNFLADAALKAAADLETALGRVPAEKRNWSAMGDARPPLDLVAECALLNGSTANLIETHQFTTDFEQYGRDKAALAQDEAAALALLRENSARVAETIRAVPSEDLAIQVEMPWGPMTLEQIISYPFWNMSYHEGQINYVASLLGCLK
ncbi:hypothetical protein EON80_24860 [bacterium]|nr:MAG: hypothetical protein EON80_24860 [bacterium]